MLAAVLLFWAAVALLCSELASAAAVEVGTPGALTPRTVGTSYTPSATESDVVQLVLYVSAAEGADCELLVSQGGVHVAGGELEASKSALKVESTVTLVVGAGQSWEVTKSGTCVTDTVRSAYTTLATGTGGEGKPGLEWEGVYSGAATYAVHQVTYDEGSSYVSLKAANTGHSPTESGSVWWELVAEKGAVGPEGKEGKSGGGGSGGEVTKFGAEAQGTIESNLAALHDDLWYVIGTMLACLVSMVIYLEARPRG